MSDFKSVRYQTSLIYHACEDQTLDRHAERQIFFNHNLLIEDASLAIEWAVDDLMERL
jgi:hypothetical protein